MRRSILILGLLLFVLCLGVAAFSSLLPRGQIGPLPTITPIVYPPESLPTPAPVPTLPPGARVIPPPDGIATVEPIVGIVRSSNPATLHVVNDWTSPITVTLQGIEIVAAPSMTETLEIPPGEYSYTIQADCGQQTDTISLEANTIHTLYLFCSPVGALGASPGSDWPSVVIDNQTEWIINFSIGPRSYKVSPGVMRVQVPPGPYTYRAHVPGVQSPAPEDVTLSAGKIITVTYRIATQ